MASLPFNKIQSAANEACLTTSADFASSSQKLAKTPGKEAQRVSSAVLSHILTQTPAFSCTEADDTSPIPAGVSTSSRHHVSASGLHQALIHLVKLGKEPLLIITKGHDLILHLNGQQTVGHECHMDFPFQKTPGESKRQCGVVFLKMDRISHELLGQ